MRRLRILQVFSRYTQVGGEESSVYRIGDTLQQDHDVEYFIGSTQELLGQDTFGRISAPFRAFVNLPAQTRLLKYQNIGNFDIWLIHNVLPGLSPSVYSAAFSMGIPVVHYLHNYRMACANGFFLNHGKPCERCLHGNFWPAFQTACWRDSRFISGFMGLILRRIRAVGTFQKVAAWIALSQAQRSKHIEMGIPQKRIHIVPHFYEPKAEPIPTNSQGNILFLGRLSPEKGVDYLLRAWKLVQAKGRKLTIAGEGPEAPKLKILAKELGLRDVAFVGFLNSDQQRAIWAQTAFSVIPSIWSEPFGLIFLEAWAQGRTFVANRLGAMAEVVKEGHDGLLAEPFSCESLASQIQRLIDSPETCVKMGSAGHLRILNEFNQAQWLKRINKVFHAVVPAL
jgi:glycosyltransferase involved in cell wall biosynthesis